MSILDSAYQLTNEPKVVYPEIEEGAILQDITTQVASEPLDINSLPTIDWYTRLQQTNLIPAQREYYFNDTKRILESYGVSSISDKDIYAYLDNNNLQGLDELILSEYNLQHESEQTNKYIKALEFSTSAVELRNALAKIKKEEADIKRIGLDDIKSIRAESSAKILVNTERKAAPKTEVEDHFLEMQAKKTQYLAQTIMDMEKQYQNEEFLGSTKLAHFADWVENFSVNLPLFSTIKNYIIQDALENRSLIDPQNSQLKRTLNAVLSGSTWQEAATSFWDLPYEDSVEVVNFFKRVYKDNPYEGRYVLSKLFGLSDTEATIENVSELVNLYFAPGMFKSAGQVLKKGSPVTPKNLKQGQAAWYSAEGEYLGKGKYKEMRTPGVSPSSTAETAKKAVVAYSAGETNVGDFLVGARNAASENIVNKIFQQQAGFPVKPTVGEIFIATPEMLSGAPTETVANAKILQETDIKDPAILTTAQLQKRGGAYLTVEDLDPQAFVNMKSQAYADFDATVKYLETMPVDVKYSSSDVDITSDLNNVNVREIYGVGQKGNSPLALSFDEAAELTKHGPFKVYQEDDGSVWLIREYTMPYNSGVATPLDMKGVWINRIATTLFSVNRAGLPKDIGAQTYQAVGNYSGWMEMLNKRYDNILKTTPKEAIELGNSIFQKEDLIGERLSNEDLAAEANFNSDVIDYVKDIRKIQDLQTAALNNLLRQVALARGDKALSLTHNKFTRSTDTIAEEFDKGIIGRKLEKPNMGELYNSFIAYEPTGEIIRPNVGLPFHNLSEVDVYELDPPFMNNNRDMVSYLVTKKGQGVTVSELPLRMLGYNPHPGWQYSYPVYIRYDAIMSDTAGRQKPYTKTLAGAESISQAKAYLKAFNKAIDIAKKAASNLISERDAGIEIQKIMLQGKYPLVGELQSLHGFLDFLSKMKASDLLTNDNLKLYIGRDTFTPISLVQLPDGTLVTGNNLAKRWSRSDERIYNPGYSITLPQKVNFNQYMGNLIRRTSSILGLQNFYSTAAKRFAATFNSLVNPKTLPPNDEAFLRDPDAFIKPEIKANPTVEYRQARAFSKMLNQALSQQSAQKFWTEEVQGATDNMIRGLDIPGVTTLGDALLKLDSMDIPQKVNSALMLATFGVTPAQFIKQIVVPASLATAVGGTAAIEAAALFIPIRLLMAAQMHNYSQRGMTEAVMNMPKILEILGNTSVAGMAADDFIALATHARQAGLGQLAYNDVRGNGLMSTNEGLMRKIIMAPFEEGNAFARLFGFLTEARAYQHKSKKPMSKFTEQEWATIIQRGDIIGGDTSVARKTALNSVPVIHSLHMMYSYIDGLLETTVFNNLHLSKKKWASMAMALTAMWGLDFWLEDDTSDKLVREISDKMDVDLSTLKQGFFGAMVQALCPYKVNINDWEPSVASKNFLWSLSEMLFNDADSGTNKYYLGAMMQRATKAATGIKNIWFYPEPDAIIPGWKEMELDEKIAETMILLNRISPSFSKAEKTAMAVAANRWIDASGYDRIPVGGNREHVALQGWNEWLLGISPDIYNLQRQIDNSKKVKEEHFKDLISAAAKSQIDFYRIYSQFYTGNDRDTYRVPAVQEASKKYQLALAIAVSAGETQAEKKYILDSVASQVKSKSKTAEASFFRQKNNPLILESSSAQRDLERYKNELLENYDQSIQQTQPLDTPVISTGSRTRRNRLRLAD